MAVEADICKLCGGLGTVDIGNVSAQTRVMIKGRSGEVVILCPACGGGGTARLHWPPTGEVPPDGEKDPAS